MRLKHNDVCEPRAERHLRGADGVARTYGVAIHLASGRPVPFRSDVGGMVNTWEAFPEWEEDLLLDELAAVMNARIDADLADGWTTWGRGSMEPITGREIAMRQVLVDFTDDAVLARRQAEQELRATESLADVLFDL